MAKNKKQGARNCPSPVFETRYNGKMWQCCGKKTGKAKSHHAIVCHVKRAETAGNQKRRGASMARNAERGILNLFRKGNLVKRNTRRNNTPRFMRPHEGD